MEINEIKNEAMTVCETKKALEETIKEKYKGEKLYKVTSTLYVDDDTDDEKTFYFVKPMVSSFDRYIKTASSNNTKALKTFVLDNIVEEQHDDFETVLEDYPAFALSIGEKLLAMLGLAKDTSVKKL
jgi:hypothetical protein